MLFFFFCAAVPLCMLDFLLRVEHIPPPRWFGDLLSLVLLTVSALFFQRAWKQGRRQGAIARKPGESGAWDPALPCLVHEIRNYSSLLKGNARLLRSQMQGDTVLEPLGRLERTTDKIEALADEILDAAYFAGHLVTVPLRLCTILDGCLIEYFPEARNRFHIEADGPQPVIVGDPLKLERAFLNLFRNAWEAGARSIRICLRRDSDRLRLSLEDDGQGCAPEAMARLFQPLYTTKKGKGGTGLGLYMVKSIVEAHGGTVRAISKNVWGQNRTGMIFELDFPIPSGLGEESILNESAKPDWQKISLEVKG